MNNYKIYYAKGIRLTLQHKTFSQAMQMIFINRIAGDAQPLKLVFTSTGKMLYMDENAFHAYLRGDITQGELIELTEMDELYRNTADIYAGSTIVESGHLWKLQKSTLTLVDDDQHITHELDLSVFEIVEKDI